QAQIILAPGDSYVFNTTQAGITVSFVVDEWDVATSPIVPIYTFGVTSGAPTVVATVPAGYVAVPFITFQAAAAFFVSPNAHSGAIAFQATPQGQTPGSAYTVFSQ